MSITNQPSGKRPKRGPSKQAAASTRLPSTRERRPALAALAVLLIAGGAVLAGWLALRQSHTDSYLIVDKSISQGEQIDSSDLRKIDLPSEGVDFIPSSQASEVVDSYAQATLLEGTVIAPGMYGDAPELEEGQAKVGLNLDPGNYPQGLHVGDPVTVLLASADTGGGPALLSSGVVRSMKSAESGGGATIDVVVSNNCSADFASGSSNGDVTLIQVPPGSADIECKTPSQLPGQGQN